jgi:iron(III) transport system substrate-binding protein
MTLAFRARAVALLVIPPLLLALAATACGGSDDAITVYSGRTESLVHPILERYNEEARIGIRVRYAGTPELAATILEEGDNSPADVFFAQDAGSLGALAAEDMLEPLPDDILAMVPAQFRSPEGTWVGISGRARVVVYNTGAIDREDLPDSILDYTGDEWSGRLGWAPPNASFQSFVTALRVLEGEDGAREWLEGIAANDVEDFPNNITLVQAVANGEIDVGFANHYYLYQFLAEEGEDFGARNYYFTTRDPGGLINVAGVAVLRTSENKEAAFDFVRFLLATEAQEYFANETFEFPLADGVEPFPGLPALGELAHPEIDLSDLDDLRGTVQLLEETGVLP